MNKHLFMDIHVIQTLPPSCVNRDDTGSPKTAVYGGVERSRVSSQAWKHAMREYFKDIFAPEELGSRTKHIPDLITEKIVSSSSEFDSEKAHKAVLDAIQKTKLRMKDDENAALIFVSPAQIKAISECIIAHNRELNAYENDLNEKGIDKDRKKEVQRKIDDLNKEYGEKVKKALKDSPSIDTMLFGRMIAMEGGDTSLNYDAVSQVAHAISTHAVHTEYDYFTAIDDEQSSDQAGASHLDTIEFNSSTLYRYATINIKELFVGVGSDTARVIKGFVKAFVCSMPTGKQNTFANRTLPDMVYITIRDDQPVNLAGAFEKPVRNDKNGYVDESCKILLEYADKIYQTFADKPVKAFGCGSQEKLSGCAAVLPLKEMLGTIEEEINEYTDEG